MADLQAALSEAVKLNRSISQFLKFSTYTDYDDLSGLDIDFTDGEQLLLWEELRRITDKLADVEEYISYLTRPITEVSRLRKGTAGKYRTAKGRYYDCCSSIEALVTDEYHNVPYWTRTTVEHNGEDYYLVGYKGLPMEGLRVRVRSAPQAIDKAHLQLTNNQLQVDFFRLRPKLQAAGA